MGTVGINFGAASSGAGFDVAATVTSILAVSSAVEDPWKTQLTSLKAQDAAFTALGTDLAALSTALGSLTSFDGALSQKLGSSSDTGVLTLTSASTVATAGSHTVVVTSLASTSSNYSDLVSASDTLSGSLSIQIGSDASSAKSITIASTSNTLTSLAKTINDGSYGVSASVVTGPAGSRLSLVSNASGLAGRITLGGSLTDATAAKTVGFTSGQPGLDAVLSVDGLPTTSASNTVTGAIPGVTFQLLSAPLNSPVQVQITNDNSAVESAAANLVSAYNKVAADIKTQTGKDATGAAEPLFGSPVLSQIQSQLTASLTGSAAVGSIKNLQQLGFSVNPDGTLAIDNTTLGSALNGHFADVLGFFQDAGSFGQSLTSTLGSLGSTATFGLVSLGLAQNLSVETALNLSVTNEDALIAAQKIRLTTELNTANQILQSIPSSLNEVNQIYSAVTGYNQQK